MTSSRTVASSRSVYNTVKRRPGQSWPGPELSGGCWSAAGGPHLGPGKRRDRMFKRLLLAGAALALATGTAAAKDLKSIGISVGSLGNVYFVTLAKGAEATAKTINPNVKVTVADLAITHISGQRRGG